MTIESGTAKQLPIGTIILLVVTFCLYVAMLASINFSAGGGDASVGRAIASLVAVFNLWVALAVLLFASVIVGQMPRWSAMTAFIGIPLAGIATFVAVDMCSRHLKWAVVIPIVLPLLIIQYAMWARWPRLHALVPAKTASMATWGAVFMISAATFILAL